MASKARQSLSGGFFGSSLNLVILPFFMRLRSSGGYDADDVASHRVSDEEHPAVDQTNSIETRLASGVEIIELNHIRVQEHFRRNSEVDAVFLPVGLFLGAVPFEVHREPDFVYTGNQYLPQGRQDRPSRGQAAMPPRPRGSRIVSNRLSSGRERDDRPFPLQRDAAVPGDGGRRRAAVLPAARQSGAGLSAGRGCARTLRPRVARPESAVAERVR